MAETILLMDKSLSSTVKKYKKEKSMVSERAASSLDYVNEAAKKLELNDTIMSSVDQTLQVVNQGIKMLSQAKQCSPVVLRLIAGFQFHYGLSAISENERLPTNY